MNTPTNPFPMSLQRKLCAAGLALTLSVLALATTLWVLVDQGARQLPLIS